MFTKVCDSVSATTCEAGSVLYFCMSVSEAASVKLKRRGAWPQVEAEIKPFKGVLLGLFFLCTGASVDVQVLLSRFPTIALLTVGLLVVKFSITAVSARLFGLSEGESVKVGLTLSQGGEFAFVLLALAQVPRPPLPCPAVGNRCNCNTCVQLLFCQRNSR